MTIQFNPRITGSFAELIMRDEHVRAELLEKGVDPKESHNLIKSVLIAGLSKYEVNINDIINKINRG